MTSSSEFVAKMQAALVRWQQAKTPLEKADAEEAWTAIIRGKPAMPQVDVKQRQAGEESD